MAANDIKLDSRRLERALSRAPGLIAKAMVKSGNRVGKRYANFHKKERLSGPRGNKGVKGTKRGLVGARKWKATGTTLQNAKLVMEVKSRRIAGEHERGANIVSRRGFMALPMPAARNPNGRVSKVARNQLKRYRSILDAQAAGNVARSEKGRRLKSPLFAFKARSGKIFIARRNRGGKPTLLFHMRKSVRLRPRLDYYAKWREFTPKAMKIYRDSLGFTLRQVEKEARVAGGA